MSLSAKNRSRILLCAWLLALVPTAGARAELIVVANEYAGTLSIIDGETGGARTLTVGGDPHDLAVTKAPPGTTVPSPSLSVCLVHSESDLDAVSRDCLAVPTA